MRAAHAAGKQISRPQLELAGLLERYWDGRALSYAELPHEAKQARIWLSDATEWFSDSAACAEAHSCGPAHEGARFALFSVPMKEITAAIMRGGTEGGSETFAGGPTWTGYHAWYTKGTGPDPAERPELWPVIANLDYGYELLFDGWHRMHTYFMRGESFVPVLLDVPCNCSHCILHRARARRETLAGVEW